jgi:hypothetical protein
MTPGAARAQRDEISVSWLFPSDEFVQVVAERTIGAESFLVEQTHGAAAQANLVRISLHANWPAHLAMPASAERHHGRCASQAACHDSGPPPAGFLEFFWSFLLDWVGHHISGSTSCCFLKIGRIAVKGKI